MAPNRTPEHLMHCRCVNSARPQSLVFSHSQISGLLWRYFVDVIRVPHRWHYIIPDNLVGPQSISVGDPPEQESWGLAERRTSSCGQQLQPSWEGPPALPAACAPELGLVPCSCKTILCNISLYTSYRFCFLWLNIDWPWTKCTNISWSRALTSGNALVLGKQKLNLRSDSELEGNPCSFQNIERVWTVDILFSIILA